jgi:hypothetical protein
MDKFQTQAHHTHKHKDSSSSKLVQLGCVKLQTDGKPTFDIPSSACSGMMMAARHAAACEAAFAFHPPYMHTIR